MATKGELLVFGYLRDNEKNVELFMNVPDAIYDEVYRWYPRLIPFEYYAVEGAFEISEDGMKIDVCN